MVQAPGDAWQITDAVTIRVLERPRIDLIEDAVAPPRFIHAREPSGARGMVSAALVAGGYIMKDKQTPHNQEGQPPTREPKETARRLEQ